MQDYTKVWDYLPHQVFSSGQREGSCTMHLASRLILLARFEGADLTGSLVLAGPEVYLQPSEATAFSGPFCKMGARCLRPIQPAAVLWRDRVPIGSHGDRQPPRPHLRGELVL